MFKEQLLERVEELTEAALEEGAALAKFIQAEQDLEDARQRSNDAASEYDDFISNISEYVVGVN